MAVESALNVANQILSFSRVQQTLEELFHYLG
jgi:hypothetical protein